MVTWSQYIAARLAVTGLTMFEVDTNLRSAAAIGRAMYRLDARHRRRANEHIRMALPELTDAQRQRTAQRSFEHLAQLAVEVCHVPRLIHRDSWARRVRLGNIAATLELFNSGKPVIMLTGHLGNWEVLGYLLAVVGMPVHAIARPLDNPLISRWLYGVRQKRGLAIITKWGAAEPMLQVLNSGGILGFIADQNAGDRGMFVPFFGRLASTYKSIGLLAIRRQVPIVCGYARRIDGRFQYELSEADIIRPDDWRQQRDPLYYVTARYMRAIEQMVRHCPEQYLWMHRRWKSRPRFEREGKPMPTQLRRNLEELPWIDQTTLDRIINAGEVSSI